MVSQVAYGRKQLAIDAGIALAALGLTLAVLTGTSHSGPDSRALDPLGGVLAALTCLPLLARRFAPLAVFVATAAASAALYGLGYGTGPPFGPTIALFFLAASPEESRPALRVTAPIVVGLFALHLTKYGLIHDELPGTEILFGTLLWGGTWIAGDRTRLRRERIAELEERALRAEREAERERRLAAAEERARIARDLHDSAGHAINVILVQAGAARLLSERDAEGSRAALETIEEVARETVAEIDQLVRALREDGVASERGEVEPPARLAALDGLLERHRAAGLAVDVSVHGSRPQLPPALDRASYRILQEALTNAARHGRGRAEVDVSFGPTALEITVTNPTEPNGASRGTGGHGIVGMRERAALLGGSVEAGASDGIYRIRARLPYGGEHG